MIEQRTLFSFRSGSTESLPDLCDRLLLQQQSTWRQLADGCAALKQVRSKEIHCDGYSVQIQFNPNRKTSTVAKVDAQSIRERLCFLCVENLPSEQQGITYDNQFLILCNPAPIFDKHLTVVHVDHIPQSIDSVILPFLQLSRSFSPAFNLFYNGPKCGASAPDHLHFQACPVGALPIETEMMNPKRRAFKKKIRETAVYSLQGIGRQVVLMEGRNVDEVLSAFERLTSVMKQLAHTDEEPMMNVLSSYVGSAWYLLVFPRRKHRPEVFFRSGEEQIMISPALVDIGGMLIAPMERDFLRVDAPMVQDIFDEVLIDEGIFEKIIDAL